MEDLNQQRLKIPTLFRLGVNKSAILIAVDPAAAVTSQFQSLTNDEQLR